MMLILCTFWLESENELLPKFFDMEKLKHGAVFSELGSDFSVTGLVNKYEGIETGEALLNLLEICIIQNTVIKMLVTFLI